MYKISDSNAQETTENFLEARAIAENWYSFIDEERQNFSHCATLDSLNSAICEWQERIAEQKGFASFAGHGRYFVSASDRMGLSLKVELL